MTKRQAKVRGQAMKLTLPATAAGPEESALFVEIAIDCPDCGEITYQFAGHHLRAIRNLLVEFIDLHPELCGEESGIKQVERMQWGGTGGTDPSVN